MTLNLKDSQYIDGITKKNSTQSELHAYFLSIDKLKKSIDSHSIETFSLQNKVTKKLDKHIVWYTYNNPNEATFYTSHYIGFYSTIVNKKPVDIEIKPRFGNGIFNYLVSYAYGLYIPKSDNTATSKSKNSNLWLITLMWKATLEKALTKSQIPKEYKTLVRNSSSFKGQLKISKHIKYNLVDKSKFYCKYRKLTMDTTINQTIRYTYKLLIKKQEGLSGILRNVSEYDNKLQSFGVQDREVHAHEIQNIRYSKLNFHYKKVMELSKLIIKSESAKNNNKALSRDSFSYFLDIAELWENYLLKVLQKNLSEYEIYSPNEQGGEYLIEENFRQIRPDIIIEKDGKIVAILDAKYKWYNKIGKYADIDNAVSRDDLYQMSTYLYHYANSDDKILGLFVSPMGADGEVKSFSKSKNHKIGVVSLDIKQFEGKEEFSLDEIQKAEKSFIEQVKNKIVEFYK